MSAAYGQPIATQPSYTAGGSLGAVNYAGAAGAPGIVSGGSYAGNNYAGAAYGLQPGTNASMASAVDSLPRSAIAGPGNAGMANINGTYRMLPPCTILLIIWF